MTGCEWRGGERKDENNSGLSREVDDGAIYQQPQEMCMKEGKFSVAHVWLDWGIQ